MTERGALDGLASKPLFVHRMGVCREPALSLSKGAKPRRLS